MNEDQIAFLSLMKTGAFLLYSVLVGFFVFGVMELTPLGTLPPETRDAVAYGMFAFLEGILGMLVIRGQLPATRPKRIEAVPERSLGLGFNILSIGAWCLARDSTEGRAYQVLFTSLLIGCLVVYFVAKSLLSGRLRLSVLSAGVVPTILLFL